MADLERLSTIIKDEQMDDIHNLVDNPLENEINPNQIVLGNEQERTTTV